MSLGAGGSKRGPVLLDLAKRRLIQHLGPAPRARAFTPRALGFPARIAPARARISRARGLPARARIRLAHGRGRSEQQHESGLRLGWTSLRKGQ